MAKITAHSDGCFTKITEVLKQRAGEEKDPVVSMEEIKAIHDELKNIRSRAFSQGVDVGGDVFRQQAMAFLKKRRLERLKKQLTVARDTQALARSHSFYTQFGGDTKRALQAELMRGEAAYTRGGNHSVEQKINNLSNSWSNQLYMGLKREKLVEFAADSDNELLILKELEQLKPGGRAGVTGVPEAAKVAKLVRATYDAQLKAKRAVGSNVGEIFGYLGKQTHDRVEIGAAGFEKWVEDIAPLIDEDLTFRNLTDRTERTKFLKGVFDDIVTESDDVFRGGANVENRFSQARTIHFKDAESFQKYNQTYGKMSTMEAVAASIRPAARDVAFMSAYGSNPKQGFETRIRDLKKEFPNSLTDADIRELRVNFDTVAGRTGHKPVTTKGQIAQNTIALMNMSKLGGAVLSQTGDLATTLGMLRASNGKNIFSNTLSAVSEFAGMFGKEHRAEWLNKLGIIVEDYMGETYARLGAVDPLGPGNVAKAQKLFYRLNGQEVQSQMAKASVGKLFAMELAEHAGTHFDELPARLKANLSRYGIDADAWGKIGGAVEDFKGTKIVTGDGIQNLPDELFKRKSDKFDLEQRIRSYILDNTETAVPTPGARQRSILLQGTTADENLGIALRFVAQFKTFPLTVVSVAKRIGLSNPESMPKGWSDIFRGKGDNANLANFLIAGTILGYASWAMKDMAAGKTPPPPDNLETWTKSFVRGGSAGIFGDYLLGEYDKRRGRGVLEALAGPAVSTGADVLELYSKIRTDLTEEGEIKKGRGGDAARLVLQNIPGNNLFYTKAAFDMLLGNQLQEAISPGFIERQAKRTRDNGQDYIFGEPPNLFE